jgi:hypothetical protein
LRAPPPRTFVAETRRVGSNLDLALDELRARVSRLTVTVVPEIIGSSLEATKRKDSTSSREAGSIGADCSHGLCTEATTASDLGTDYSRLTRSKYRSVKSAVSAAAMYVKAAAVRTRLVPPASRPERMP